MENRRTRLEIIGRIEKYFRLLTGFACDGKTNLLVCTCLSAHGKRAAPLRRRRECEPSRSPWSAKDYIHLFP